MHVHDVALALLHALLLFAEGAEEVFYQSPVEECSILVYPRHFEVCKVAHLAQRVLGGSHRTFVLVEIYKHFELVARLRAFGYVAFGQQNLSLVAAVEIQSEVNLLDHGHLVVITKFYHIFCFVLSCYSPIFPSSI